MSADPQQLAPAIGRWTNWVAMAVWAVLASLCMAMVVEYDCYARMLSLREAGLTAADRLLLVWLLAASSLIVFLAALAPSAAMLHNRRPRLAWALAGILATLAAWWLVIDLKTFAVTGNHVFYYLRFAQPTAGENAGGYGWMVRLATVSASVAAAAVAGSMWLCRAIVVRTIARAPRGARWRTLVTTHLIAAAMLTGWLAWQGRFTRPAVLRSLCANLPIDLSGFIPGGAAERRFAEQLGPVLDARRDALTTPAPLDTSARLDESHRPNIVLIVCESFRRDAIEPDTMPRVDAWSKRGLRLTRHYSGSNATPMGLFELLYGRSCMGFTAALDAKLPPQLLATLHASGYQSTFISCVTQRWQRIEEFVGESTFSHIEVKPTGDWIAGDRRTVERVAEILRTSAGQPQFVLAFLQCTHLPYLYPAERERHTPVIAAGASVLDFTGDDEPAMKNRYRNAAGYLDSLIGPLVESLDPARTIAIVTGDHGESFFDDGTAFHASRLSDMQSQTPMVMVGGHIQPGHDDRLTVHADLLPTLLHAAAGRAMPVAGTTGIDLLAPPADQPREGILLSRTCGDPWNLACVRPDGRISVHLSLKSHRVELDGVLGTNGLIDQRRVLSADEGAQWADCVARLLWR